MNHMPEAVPQQSETPGETPSFFRLRQADAPVVGEALHRIAESGMGDPEAARGLLSLFDAVPDITEDKFHIFSQDNAQTLWDQVSDSISREKTLTSDQKGALTALKYFALESVTETGPAPLRDEAQEELQRYGAQLAKTMDPDDPATVRFFETAGKAAGKTARTVGLTSLILSILGTRCGGPTISPTPTNPNIPVATETFTPTETLQVTYQADVVDITALYEAQPTADNPLTKAYVAWLAQAKEISDLPDPRIWALQVKSNGTLTENIVLAQSQYTHDTYILNIVSGEGDSAQSTRVNSQMFARAVMGKEGAYQNVEYYYKDQAGNKIDILTYDQQSGKFVYTTLDGQKEELDGLGIYFGKTEDPSTGGKLLSLVPPGEDFYRTLPEGAVINMETRQITDSSGALLYKYESGKWLSAIPTETPTPIPFESGPSLEFSPLFPAEWHKEWVGNVTLADGSTLQIPIIIGLASDVIHNPDPNGQILGVWMKQQGVDAWADAFLRASHYRYTEIMGNTATYEQYLEILKQPIGGEISVGIMDNDGKTMRVAMIDPRQGLSLLMTDKLKMPVTTSINYGIFLGVDGKGRLLSANNNVNGYPTYPPRTKMFGVSTQGYVLLKGSFGQVLEFGAYSNDCLLKGLCSERITDPKAELVLDWLQMSENIIIRQINDQKLDLLWGLVTP